MDTTPNQEAPTTDTKTTKPTLAERALFEFKRLRNEALTKNGHTKFAETEQMHVIIGLINWMTSDDEASAEGTDSIAVLVQAVANASAYAQLLDKHGVITRAARGSGGSKAKFV